MFMVGGGVAEGAVSEGLDLVFLRSVLARSAHPGVVVQQWLACCYAYRELCSWDIGWSWEGSRVKRNSNLPVTVASF